MDTELLWNMDKKDGSYTETTNLNWFTQIVELVTTVTDHQNLTITKTFKF